MGVGPYVRRHLDAILGELDSLLRVPRAWIEKLNLLVCVELRNNDSAHLGFFRLRFTPNLGRFGDDDRGRSRLALNIE